MKTYFHLSALTHLEVQRAKNGTGVVIQTETPQMTVFVTMKRELADALLRRVENSLLFSPLQHALQEMNEVAQSLHEPDDAIRMTEILKSVGHDLVSQTFGLRIISTVECTAVEVEELGEEEGLGLLVRCAEEDVEIGIPIESWPHYTRLREQLATSLVLC